ncbi:hypothetical protein BESB_035490 [Besnoitia besnoiti]|uniref:Uncharacterized protein n=1 Tax=Besnoitia besnoiti TaxID=94643 RepID=A0A2A9MLA3_BESBE|nr:hypothetical protein BESB_035490 [Besnoitia besnoiti]PFH37091.1 hypothetical protein BESB_035490 [Besnoitia besnoiti]
MMVSCRSGAAGIESTRPRSTRLRVVGHRLSRPPAANIVDFNSVTEQLARRVARNPFVPWKVLKRSGAAYQAAPAAPAAAVSDSAASLHSIKANRIPARRLKKQRPRQRGASVGSFHKPDLASPGAAAVSPLFHAAACATRGRLRSSQHLPACRRGMSFSSCEEPGRAEEGVAVPNRQSETGAPPHPPVPPWWPPSGRGSEGNSWGSIPVSYCYPLSRPEAEDPLPLPLMHECRFSFENVSLPLCFPSRSTAISEGGDTQASDGSEVSLGDTAGMAIAGLGYDLDGDVARGTAWAPSRSECKSLAAGKKAAPFVIRLRTVKHQHAWRETLCSGPPCWDAADEPQLRRQSSSSSAVDDSTCPTEDGGSTAELPEKTMSPPSSASIAPSERKEKLEDDEYLRTVDTQSLDSSLADKAASGGLLVSDERALQLADEPAVASPLNVESLRAEARSCAV